MLTQDGDTIEREAYIGPKVFSRRKHPTLTLDPEKSIKLTMSGDRVAGERTMALSPTVANGTRIGVAWDLAEVRTGVRVRGSVKTQRPKATEGALPNIAEWAEAAWPCNEIVNP